MKEHASYLSRFLIMAGLLLLVGCGSGKTLVMSPTAELLKVQAVEMTEGVSTVNVPGEVKIAFHDKLAHFLYEEEGAFERGPELKITYRFIQYNPGNQFTRWFWGGIGNAGEGTMTVEAKYLTPDGKELSTIQAEGKIGSGAFGGSFNYAVEKTAKEIANYTKLNFR